MASSSTSAASPTPLVGTSAADDLIGAIVVTLGSVLSCIPPGFFIILVVLLIASPISLYLDRVEATVVVFALIGAAMAAQLVRHDGRLQSRAGQRISRAAFLFLAYMTLNCAWSIS